MSMFNETQGHVNILWRNTHMYNHIPHKDTYGYTVTLSWGPCNFCACVCCFYENLDIPIWEREIWKVTE